MCLDLVIASSLDELDTSLPSMISKHKRHAKTLMMHSRIKSSLSIPKPAKRILFHCTSVHDGINSQEEKV